MLLKIISFLLLYFLVLLQNLQGQDINGTVSSSSGPLHNATIELKAKDHSRQYTNTNEQGAFQFNNLSDSSYSLTVKHTGYKDFYKQVVTGNFISIELQSDTFTLSEIKLSSGRIGKPRNETISLSIIDTKSLQEQAAISTNLNDIISKTVPGVAQSTESSSNYGQGIRGREMLVMLDGIPLSTPIRNSSRELNAVDISAIEGIEVIRGTTALYGHGSTGGLVNYTTKNPNFSKDTLLWASSINGNTSLVFHNNAYQYKAPLGGRFMQQVMGRKNKVSFLANGAISHIGKYYDAEGDLIPLDPLGQGGLANSNILSTLGKLRYQFSEHAGIEAKVLYYNSQQEAGYIALPGVYGKTKAHARESSKTFPDQLGTAVRNLNTSINYNNDSIFKNTSLNMMGYFQKMYSRFPYDPYSSFFPPYNGKTSAQTFIDSKKTGFRTDFKTSFTKSKKSFVNYGLDAVYDQTDQNLTDGRVWVPPIQQLNIAPFVQASYKATRKLLVKGGIRLETVVLSVDDFTVLTTGKSVQGGSLNYTQPLFNGSVRYNFHKAFSPYLSFSQGFATTEVGRELRATNANKVTDLKPKAQVVNNYEFGWNSKAGNFGIAGAAFLNTSKYGVTLIGTSFDVERAPELIYGAELEVSYQIEKWKINTTASYVEGKRDLNNNGNYTEYLPGNRIAPPKVTASVFYKIFKKTEIGLQGLYSGNRKRFENGAGFGFGNVDDYFLMDLMLSQQVWKGTLSLGINNFLNTFYFPPVSQWANSSLYYVAGRGRTVSITYSIAY